MPLIVALNDNGRLLGDVIIRVEKDDSISISKGSLLSVLKGDGASDVLNRIAPMPDMIQLSDLKAVGIGITFDKQKIILVMGLTAGQRSTGDISFAPPALVSSGMLAKPAAVSGYLNLFAESDYLWNSNQTALRFDVEAVLRAGSAVFESEFDLQNQVNPQFCPNGALCLFNHSSGVKRRGSRMIYDFPEWQDRFTLGDARINPTTFQRGPDVAGITIEHSLGKLDPTKTIRATGTQSFVLERPATVDVLINGAVSQRLQLPPGSYNLRDLPLRAGANDIALFITDDTGASRTFNFSMFSAFSLLSTGKSEWSFSAGIPSYYKDDGIAYLDNQYIASGFMRYGVTSALTVEGQAQSDNHVVMSGFGGISSTNIGVFGLNAAASATDGGIGVGGALRATWDIAGSDNKDSLRVTGEWHSSEFRSPGQLQIIPTGIIFPVYDYKSSIAGVYSREIGENWQASVTARYDVDNTQFVTSNPLVAHGDRYHADLSLTHPLFEDATISGTIGYSNEIYNRSFDTITQADLNDTKGKIWGGVRLFWRPRERVIVTESSDTLNKRTLTTGSYQSSPGIDSWSTNASVAGDQVSGNTAGGAEVGYRGQRAEIAIAHDGDLRSQDSTSNGASKFVQRTRVRAGTALVFADDAFAVSAPLRGDGGFAILTPHESLGDRTITAGTRDYLRAKSDGMGFAVASGLAPYFPQTLPVDVADLPIGYSLGASGFDLAPPYKAGYKLVVGSGYAVSALGELVDGYGQPLALTGGIASNGSKQVAVFTNQGGKFAADGLAPGHWTLKMESEAGQIAYDVNVPEGTEGLVRLGTLRPAKG